MASIYLERSIFLRDPIFPRPYLIFAGIKGVQGGGLAKKIRFTYLNILYGEADAFYREKALSGAKTTCQRWPLRPKMPENDQKWSKTVKIAFFKNFQILFLFTTKANSLAIWHLTRPQGYKQLTFQIFDTSQFSGFFSAIFCPNWPKMAQNLKIFQIFMAFLC